MDVLDIAKEGLIMIIKRDDWTGGECRHHAKKTIAKIGLEKYGEMVTTAHLESIGGNKTNDETSKIKCGKCSGIACGCECDGITNFSEMPDSENRPEEK